MSFSVFEASFNQQNSEMHDKWSEMYKALIASWNAKRIEVESRA